MPAGLYVLVQRANPERRLRELELRATTRPPLLLRTLVAARASSLPPRIDVLRTLRGRASAAPPRRQVTVCYKARRRVATPTIRRVEHVDVLVVGAGPAGSATAMRLARARRARPPRRPGAVPPRQAVRRRAHRSRAPARAVRRDAGRRARRRHASSCGCAGGRRFRRRSAAPLIAMTQRRRLDAHLVGAGRRGGGRRP